MQENLKMEISITPRFRSTSRLVVWLRRNNFRSRLPPESEACFFKSKESAFLKGKNLVLYANYSGNIGSELEALIPNEMLGDYCCALLKRGNKPEISVLNRMSQEHLVSCSSGIGRLPVHIESKITDPFLLANYSFSVGRLDENMEGLLSGHIPSLIKYFSSLKHQGIEIPENLLRLMRGRDEHFISLTKVIGLLPVYLEETISDPEVAILYARQYKKQCLVESAEECLMKDLDIAARYGIDVKRAWSSPRLPDYLHNAIYMDTSSKYKANIITYISEVERVSGDLDV